MEAMRESWSDERLDDLNQQVNELGRRVDNGFNSLRAEMNARFDQQDARFDSNQRLMIQLWAGTMFTLLAGVVTLLTTQL